MGRFNGIVAISLLAALALCLFEFSFYRHVNLAREFEASLLSLQGMVLLCLVVWSGTLFFLAHRALDWFLIVLLLSMVIFYLLAGYSVPDALLVVFTIILGKGTRFFLANQNGKSGVEKYLIGVIGLLTFSAWWHPDLSDNYYCGPRWMGLWDNPNIYGMLMGAGGVLAIGLRAGMKKQTKDVRILSLRFFLFVAAGMMAVGQFFSYSRGAWVGTALGLLYLAKAHEKFKWRWVLSGLLVAAVVVVAFWHSTADTDQWYLKRLDLSRPSAQHRVAAWRGALQMMRDHPLGVGWNQAVSTYEKNYSPPKDGAAALTMNSYLMLGTELGLPVLLCFVTYVGLALKTENRKHKGESLSSAGSCDEASDLRCACRAGAIVLLVAFWFDGGLFNLPTAAVFWILLELGTSDLVADKNRRVAQPTSRSAEHLAETNH